MSIVGRTGSLTVPVRVEAQVGATSVDVVLRLDDPAMDPVYATRLVVPATWVELDPEPLALYQVLEPDAAEPPVGSVLGTTDSIGTLTRYPDLHGGWAESWSGASMTWQQANGWRGKARFVVLRVGRPDGARGDI